MQAGWIDHLPFQTTLALTWESVVLLSQRTLPWKRLRAWWVTICCNCRVNTSVKNTCITVCKHIEHRCCRTFSFICTIQTYPQIWLQCGCLRVDMNNKTENLVTERQTQMIVASKVVSWKQWSLLPRGRVVSICKWFVGCSTNNTMNFVKNFLKFSFIY